MYRGSRDNSRGNFRRRRRRGGRTAPVRAHSLLPEGLPVLQLLQGNVGPQQNRTVPGRRPARTRPAGRRPAAPASAHDLLRRRHPERALDAATRIPPHRPACPARSERTRRVDPGDEPGDRLAGEGNPAADARGQPREHGGAVLGAAAPRGARPGPQRGTGAAFVRNPARGRVRQREPRPDLRRPHADARAVAAFAGGDGGARAGTHLGVQPDVRGGHGVFPAVRARGADAGRRRGRRAVRVDGGHPGVRPVTSRTRFRISPARGANVCTTSRTGRPGTTWDSGRARFRPWASGAGRTCATPPPTTTASTPG